MRLVEILDIILMRNHFASFDQMSCELISDVNTTEKENVILFYFRDMSAM